MRTPHGSTHPSPAAPCAPIRSGHTNQSTQGAVRPPHKKVSVWDAFCGLFRGYEQTVFVPLWGLRDMHEYHSRASVHTHVSNIARPLLVVHARDDPVVPVESLPLEQASRGPTSPSPTPFTPSGLATLRRSPEQRLVWRAPVEVRGRPAATRPQPSNSLPPLPPPPPPCHVKQMAANPNIVTAITRHGGHMGYTAGRTPLLGAWTDRILLHYLRHIMSRGAAAGREAPQGNTIANILREHSKL